MKDKSETYNTIYEIFDLCEIPKSSLEIDSLINTLDSSIGTMAMVDYPYPTSFVEPLPAWPVNAACDAAQAAFDKNYSDPNVALYAIQGIGKTFYNYND
jgi:lysosomal Pro-X carboxypeptidase